MDQPNPGIAADQARQGTVQQPYGVQDAADGEERVRPFEGLVGGPPTIVTATPWQHEPPLSGSDYGPVIGLALQWGGQEHSILRMTGGATDLRQEPRRSHNPCTGQGREHCRVGMLQQLKLDLLLQHVDLLPQGSKPSHQRGGDVRPGGGFRTGGPASRRPWSTGSRNAGAAGSYGGPFLTST
nr:hypothetical protein [Micromonospora palomenae]